MHAYNFLSLDSEWLPPWFDVRWRREDGGNIRPLEIEPPVTVQPVLTHPSQRLTLPLSLEPSTGGKRKEKKKKEEEIVLERKERMDLNSNDRLPADILYWKQSRPLVLSLQGFNPSCYIKTLKKGSILYEVAGPGW